MCTNVLKTKFGLLSMSKTICSNLHFLNVDFKSYFESLFTYLILSSLCRGSKSHGKTAVNISLDLNEII